MSKPKYRVVYGETIPIWEMIFPTLKEAVAFAKAHKAMGDIVFSVRATVDGEGPQSILAGLNPENSNG